MKALWAWADDLSMRLYTTLRAKGLCLLLGRQPTGSSSGKAREPLSYSTELRYASLPPVPSVGDSGVTGDRGPEEPKYFTWLVMSLAAPRGLPGTQVPPGKYPAFETHKDRKQ